MSAFVNEGCLIFWFVSAYDVFLGRVNQKHFPSNGKPGNSGWNFATESNISHFMLSFSTPIENTWPRDVSGRWEESLGSCGGKNISTTTTRLLLFISETSLISIRSQTTLKVAWVGFHKIRSVPFKGTTKDQIQVAEGQKKSPIWVALSCSLDVA